MQLKGKGAGTIPLVERKGAGIETDPPDGSHRATDPVDRRCQPARPDAANAIAKSASASKVMRGR